MTIASTPDPVEVISANSASIELSPVMFVPLTRAVKAELAVTPSKKSPDTPETSTVFTEVTANEPTDKATEVELFLTDTLRPFTSF